MFQSRKNSRRLPSRTTENRSILPVPPQKQLIIFFKKMKTNKQKKLNARPGKKTEIWYFLPASGVKHISISRHKHEIPASLLHIFNIVQPLIVRLLDQHRDRSELIFLESLAEKWECKLGAVAVCKQRLKGEWLEVSANYILVWDRQGRGFSSGVIFREPTEAPPRGGATVLQHHSRASTRLVCPITSFFRPNRYQARAFARK